MKTNCVSIRGHIYYQSKYVYIIHIIFWYIFYIIYLMIYICMYVCMYVCMYNLFINDIYIIQISHELSVQLGMAA